MKCQIAARCLFSFDLFACYIYWNASAAVFGSLLWFDARVFETTEILIDSIQLENKGWKLYSKQILVKHIKKVIFSISQVFTLFCPTPVETIYT